MISVLQVWWPAVFADELKLFDSAYYVNC